MCTGFIPIKESSSRSSWNIFSTATPISFKRQAYFHPGDIVLDPFAGSGTTLVQANELGIHAVGLDISRFNCLIAETKLESYNHDSVLARCQELYRVIKGEHDDSGFLGWKKNWTTLVGSINKKYFPNDYRYKIVHEGLTEEAISQAALAEVNRGWRQLRRKHSLVLRCHADRLQASWIPGVQHLCLKRPLAARILLEQMPEAEKKLLTVLLSRALRSCRTTPHYQLERPGSNPFLSHIIA